MSEAKLEDRDVLTAGHDLLTDHRFVHVSIHGEI